MTGTTATQNLVYPTSGDLLKDQGKYHRDLAVALDNRLRSHDVDIARSARPPFALVERTTQKTYDLSFGGQSVLFDFENVLEDTAGMVSLENDSSVIQTTGIGWWNIGVYAKLAQTSCSPGYCNLYISNDTGDTVNLMHDAVVGFVAGSSEDLIRVVNSTIGFPKITAHVSFSGSNCASTFTILYARMWAYKVRDL